MTPPKNKTNNNNNNNTTKPTSSYGISSLFTATQFAVSFSSASLLLNSFQIAPSVHQIASAKPAITSVSLYADDIFQSSCPLGCIPQGWPLPPLKPSLLLAPKGPQALTLSLYGFSSFVSLIGSSSSKGHCTLKLLKTRVLGLLFCLDSILSP